jgi:acetyl esterase/lipase
MRKIYNQDVHSPWFSPLNLDLARIKPHYPKRAYVQGIGLDIIRDDAVIYEKVLKDEGLAETKFDIFKHYSHVCWANLPLDEAHSQETKEKSMDGMAWVQDIEWDKTKPLPYYCHKIVVKRVVT